MNADRFDALSWALSGEPSRRRLLQALLAALAGDALGLIRVEAATTCPGIGVPRSCKTDGDCADCTDAVCQANACRRPTGGNCRRNRQCASGRCNRKKHACRGCPAGTIPCGGHCVSGSSCAEVDPSACSSCASSKCITPCTCCAGSCNSQTAQCVCLGPPSDCSDNHACCSSVCGSDGKCTCTAPDGGCVRDRQCCSGLCQANGRCAPFCPDGGLRCNGVCCPDKADCVGGECFCEDTHQPPCGGVQCCASGTSCMGGGVCLSDPN